VLYLHRYTWFVLTCKVDGRCGGSAWVGPVPARGAKDGFDSRSGSQEWLFLCSIYFSVLCISSSANSSRHSLKIYTRILYHSCLALPRVEAASKKVAVAGSGKVQSGQPQRASQSRASISRTNLDSRLTVLRPVLSKVLLSLPTPDSNSNLCSSGTFFMLFTETHTWQFFAHQGCNPECTTPLLLVVQTARLHKTLRIPISL
jgi:hypothetical protein